MNPSAQGWINKLLTQVDQNNLISKYDEASFYNALRASGFIYGNNLSVVTDAVEKRDLTEGELSKTNLLIAFLHTHHYSKSDQPFIESVVGFYAAINALKTSFFQELLGGILPSEQLEKIIHKRIQIDPNLLTKNFNYFIINALLYVDVLAYAEYLKVESITTDFIKNLEIAIASISLEVLNSKQVKNQYDESLIKLFEASSRYQDGNYISYQEAVIFINTPLKKYYMLDLACMASWSDKIIDKSERQFLLKLGGSLKLTKQNVSTSIETIHEFYTTNKDKIALLSSKNMVQSFYNNSSKIVTTLISRNSKRLYQELKDSKELMVLLTQSTTRDLTQEEQKKVNEQLLDIFKTIPSLAIVLLPGGALLLPFIIKFIPKLLPSAFDENRIEE